MLESVGTKAGCYVSVRVMFTWHGCVIRNSALSVCSAAFQTGLPFICYWSASSKMISLLFIILRWNYHSIFRFWNVIYYGIVLRSARRDLGFEHLISSSRRESSVAFNQTNCTFWIITPRPTSTELLYVFITNCTSIYLLNGLKFNRYLRSLNKNN